MYRRLSAKITTVSYRRLLMALCRALPFAECLALGKDFFAECISVPRVLLSVNVVVTENRSLPSATLGKAVFAECPTESTRHHVVGVWYRQHTTVRERVVRDARRHAIRRVRFDPDNGSLGPSP
jgi:hypothetical protein